MQKEVVAMIKAIAIVEAIIIIILAIVVFNSHDIIQSQKTDITALEAKEVVSQNKIASLKADGVVLQNNIDTLKADEMVLQSNIAAAQVKITELTKKLQATLPYTEAKGEQIKLTNQSNTHNPTWSELKTFLQKDNTESLPYVDNLYTCGDFATTLHDNAEKAGIRAGVVAIDFENDAIGHGINIFYTTDRGMVYIDDTGTDTASCKYDGVGYLEVGKDYGTVDIIVANSFLYEDYVSMANMWKQYNSDVEAYNAYITYLNGKTSCTSAELSKAQDWEAKLKLERSGLPKCFSKPLGIVKDFKLYW